MNLTGEAKVVLVGRHKIKVRPPSLRWWLKAVDELGQVYMNVAVLVAMEGKATLPLFQAKLKSPALAILDRLAETTDKRARWPRRPCAWYLANLTASELALFINEWLKAVGVEEIKEGFTRAGLEIRKALGQPADRKTASPE